MNLNPFKKKKVPKLEPDQKDYAEYVATKHQADLQRKRLFEKRLSA